MKVIIAPDKFRGSLTAVQAAESIAQGLSDVSDIKETVILPMADGGEGSAAALLGPDAYELDTGLWRSTDGSEICVVSSEIVGYSNAELMSKSLPDRTTETLGDAILRALNLCTGAVYVCIGGTCTCDAGQGLLSVLRPGFDGRQRITVLCDVDVPLLDPEGKLDAMSFVAQKGASESDYPLLRKRLERAQALFPDAANCCFGGAGGGLGFALNGCLGLRTYLGARYIIDRHKTALMNADVIVTGEGCIDAQTSGGKVVSVLEDFAAKTDKAFVAFAGQVVNAPEGSSYIQVTPAGVGQAWRNADIAAEYLKEAVRDYFS